uniref:Uncharacterized protein n=1 Tax=viral metagenome TaxID=1070528 RepID=A0A6M3L072_9ZZZZ
MDKEREELCRALAKIIAFKRAGKDKEAEEWFVKLVSRLAVIKARDSDAKG